METPNPLTAEDVFGVGVRLAALYPLFLAYERLLFAAYARAGWAPTEYVSTEAQLLYTFGYGILGIVVLCNASAITGFAYRTLAPSDTETSEKNGAN